MPENLDGILKYLSGGAVKGIGPATARRLVTAFGAETLSVLENDPERVAKLKGITLKKAQDISEQLKSMIGIRELMVFLAGYGITANAAVRIWKKLGGSAIPQIEENPYILCEQGLGVSFETADAIALSREFPQDARVRIPDTPVCRRTSSSTPPQRCCRYSRYPVKRRSMRWSATAL